MSIFRRRKAEFFDPEPAEVRFDAMMNLVKDLSRKEYNQLKKAMDAGYNAYQIMRGIETDDVSPLDNTKFELDPNEGKVG